MQSLMATMDSIQPHRIALKSRVLMESPQAHMSSQYLCGTSRPDRSHIIHEVVIRDGKGEMQCVQVLINRGVMSILMALRLRERLRLADEPAYVTTLGLNGQVIAHVSDSRKTAFTVQYMEQNVTGSRIGGASGAYAGLPHGFGIALDPVQES
jgi:hypothetical protein